MLPYLRRRYPDAHIAMLLNRYAGEVVDGNPCLDELIWYDNEAHRPLSFGAMRSVIRGRTFDAAVVVHPTPRLAWLMRRSGIPVRIGSGYRYYSLLS